MTLSTTELEKKLKFWFENNFSIEQVESELTELGLDTDLLEMNLRTFKKMKYANKHFAGIVCVIIGAVLGVLSCMLAILNPLPALFNLFLFAFTPLAIIILFIGLFLLFE